MGKQKKVIRPKTKITWARFAKFWSARGLSPDEATNVIADNWLDVGWNDGIHFNMFKDPENQKLAMGYLDYVHEYMAANRLKFKAACLKLAKTHDSRTIDTLAFLLVPKAVDLSKGKILVAPSTFAKWCGWWRNYLFADDYLERLKELEKNNLKFSLAKKKKTKRK